MSDDANRKVARNHTNSLGVGASDNTVTKLCGIIPMNNALCSPCGMKHWFEVKHE